jgi:hypothetical protein
MLRAVKNTLDPAPSAEPCRPRGAAGVETQAAPPSRRGERHQPRVGAVARVSGRAAAGPRSHRRPLVRGGPAGSRPTTTYGRFCKVLHTTMCFYNRSSLVVSRANHRVSSIATL